VNHGSLGCRPDGVIGMSPLRGYCSPSEAEESKHYRSPSEAEESQAEESQAEESKHYRTQSEAEESEAEESEAEESDVEESIPYNFSSGSPTTL
jgi:hypothetical protein